jgi:hypothetical protein
MSGLLRLWPAPKGVLVVRALASGFQVSVTIN